MKSKLFSIIGQKKTNFRDLLIIFSLALISNNLFSQNHFGGDEEPYDQATLEEMELFQNYYINHKGEKSSNEYVIPVVVHIIHNNGPENISNSTVLTAIELLNEQFKGEYGGYDCDIKFKLAKVDPDGNCTEGITRTQYANPRVNSNNTGNVSGYVSELAIKNLIRWPTENYLNIWIVQSVKGNRSYADETEHWVNVGFVSKRIGSPSWSSNKDGLLIQYTSFGNGSWQGMSSSGMTTFGVGQYLGLNTVWGIIADPNGCCHLDEENDDNNPLIGDMINDTAPCNYYDIDGFDELITEITSCSYYSNCDNPNTCYHPIGTPAIPNPINGFPKDNFMSYNWPCQNKFTQGQAEWMWNSIDFYRSNISSESNLIATGIIDDIPISTTWNANDFDNGIVYVGENLTVNTNSILTINENVTVKFGDNVKLIIETGAKVIVNGGTLTNLCDHLWYGVDILGNSLLSQNFPGYSNQGRLVMTNGALIENASFGVIVRGGGVINAVNSLFQNNGKDVYFSPYQGYNSQSLPIYNKSSFNKCDFIVNEQVIGINSLANSTRVQLTVVDGIRFIGCKFGIEENALSIYSYSQRGCGILSFNGGYRVKNHCSGYINSNGTCGGSETASKFNNLDYGIFSTAADVLKTFKVENAEFNNNRKGVHAVNSENLSIINNTFNITANNPIGYGSYYTYGIHLADCNGYEIEENEFYSTDISLIPLGVVITDSDDNPNRIYYNEFHDLYVGTIAQGDNQVDGFWREGLQILCGQYENNTFDIACTGNSRIAFYQGSNEGSDDEKFSPANQFLSNVFDCPNNRMMYISNNSEQFNYYYKQGEHPFENTETFSCWNQLINDQKLHNVNDEPILFQGRDQECITGLTYGGDSDVGKKDKIIEKRDLIITSTSTVNQLEDGGITTSLLSDYSKSQ